MPLRGEIFFEGVFPHLSFISTRRRKMFVEALYNYTLKSPVGEFLSVQSVDGVFDVLREYQGYEFISRTLVAYRSCGIAD